MQNKIAIINSVCGIGSTGRLCDELAVFLEKKGYDVCIFFGRNPNHFKSSYSCCFSNPIDTLIHGVNSRLFDSSGLSSKFVTDKLIKKLDFFNPDLIILNNLHGYYLNISTLFNWIKNNNKRIILVCHDCWNFTGHCAYFDFVKCEKWKTQCFSCPAKHSYPKSVFFDRSKRNFIIKKELYSKINNMTIVTPSIWLSKLIRESFLKTYPVEVINNGIDVEKFKKIDSDFRIRNGLAGKKLILCIANVFEKRKGIDDIIRLSNILNDDEMIILVGHLKNRTNLCNDKIFHIEQTNDLTQLIELYSTSDVMFNPTYEDNYPTTNIESLSCGTPVICYRTGGATETIDDYFVVEQGDFVGAHQKMRELFNNKRIYIFPSIDLLSKETMHNKYLSLVKKLLKNEVILK